MSKGCTAVPLAVSHPPAELLYTLQDSDSTLLIHHPMFNDKIAKVKQSMKLDTIELSRLPTSQENGTEAVDPHANALFIYTSGTTGKPKGAVHTQASIASNIQSLLSAWKWTMDDSILHLLPLHHVHGLINCLLCPIAGGATVEFMPWDATKVWQRLNKRDTTVFMGVPTMYSKLLSAHSQMTPEEQSVCSETVQGLRLQVSGSAPLPETLFEAWREISKTPLLERYGMTEIGMALGNPYEGPRVKGTVGVPFPNVQVKLVDSDTLTDISGLNQGGELYVKGGNVFKEYYNRPDATRETFDGEWFKTGDIVSRITVEGSFEPYYKILGRASQDIIKSSGFKISALEIERDVLDHPEVSDAAVFGLPDDEYGERVAAVIVAAKSISEADLKEFLKARLAPYKVPSRYLFLDEMPRNAMGKVMKKDLKKLFSK
jgi:malonyl-CoA/methylmalonyl-CoA synthetase